MQQIGCRVYQVLYMKTNLRLISALRMKPVITLLLLIFSCSAFSQVQKNQWLIGGNAAFSFERASELKTTTLQLAPDIGYFFIDKLAGGLRFNFGSTTNRWEKDDKYRNSSMIISPFVRCYFLPATQKVNVFAEGAYGYAWSKYKDFAYGSSYAYHYHNLSLVAGPAIFLNKHTALEVTVAYNYSTRGSVDSSHSSKFLLGVGLQIHFGKAKE